MTDRKYHIEIHDAEGVIVGDGSQVTQKFERAPECQEDWEQTSDLSARCDDLIERGKNIRDTGIPSDADSELEFNTWLRECYAFLEEAGGDVKAFQIYEYGWVSREAQEFQDDMIDRLGILQATKKRLRRAWPSDLIRKATRKAKEWPSTAEEQAFLEQELAQHKRNLGKLRLKLAKYTALEAPIHLLNQIEDEEQEIGRIEAELERREGEGS
ncbi:MAG: hypothetical protein H8D78_03090 [Chloroflexi bacterium]|nr:hypothetical protein [Chloroflexota bacterium]